MANKKSQINIDVSMDENNVPEKLTWSASDVDEKPQDTKALFLSVWDSNAKQTLKMDLWTKDMRVDEMKYFFYSSTDHQHEKGILLVIVLTPQSKTIIRN